MKLSIIIPAKNEAVSLGVLLHKLIGQKIPDCEIIVVDDGSSDETYEIARSAGVRIVQHPYSCGNGAAVKSGARAAKGEILLFMDADGQHEPIEIPKILAVLENGYDMVVGARRAESHANLSRRIANAVYNWLATAITGHKILDLTSGFRAARAIHFREFLPLFPNGFSYPTTSTMCFLRAGYRVKFQFVDVAPRPSESESHIRPIRDGGRFFIIIFKVASLYSPLKIFAPISASLFATGCWYYAYTYIVDGRYTNMGMTLFLSSIFVFLIGLISEQITMLMHLTAGGSDSKS